MPRPARQQQIESCLTAGGTVLAASERAARAILAEYHTAQRDSGQTAWKTPAILSWETWLRDQWQPRNTAGAMLLNPLQEQSLWLRIIERSRRDLLHAAKLAEAAMRAYRLLAAYAPQHLRTSARQAWSGDAAVFSDWIGEFEAHYRREGLISPSKLTLDLTESLQNDPQTRPKLLLAGFDRILLTQQSLLNAWGEWEQLIPTESALTTQFLAAPDPATEAEACATWLRQQLAANPHARLMVVATGLESRRGQLERAFQNAANPASGSVKGHDFSRVESTPSTGKLNSPSLVTGHGFSLAESTPPTGKLNSPSFVTGHGFSRVESTPSTGKLNSPSFVTRNDLSRVESTPSTGKLNSPSFVTRNDLSRVESTPPTGKLNSRSFVTGHDFSRAENPAPNEGALAPAALDFEFSMGLPLARIGLARSAVLLLRWLQSPIAEPELDWLLGCGHLAASPEEEIAFCDAMRQIRNRGQERPDWPIAEFARYIQSGRLVAAQNLLAAEPDRQSPLQWAAVAERLLDALHWPGFRPLTSFGFQAQDRLQRLLEECGSLGFDGSKIPWQEFVATLTDAVSTTLFAAESREAPIQITGPLESAGQLADAIWFLGAGEEDWPGRGQPDPLIPIALQRESGMPHASPQADWTLAAEATQRLIASATTVVFSYAQQSNGVEARPSRIILQKVGPAEEIAASPAPATGDQTETFADWTQLPFPNPAIPGGAATLTRQSLCPFQAFAATRLNAQDWDPAEAGLNPRQRGQLLHAVLHNVWSKPSATALKTAEAPASEGFVTERDVDRAEQASKPNVASAPERSLEANPPGLRNLAELQAIPDLPQFVTGIVNRVMAETFDPHRRNSLPARFPPRYLQLEAHRLTTLVTEWLAYERLRQPFTVAETEVQREITIAGLTLRLRLDRIDQLADGSRLVIDYKTGSVGPRAWEGDRPDDVQLPLYATFAVPEALEGLVFATVRPGESHFAGRLRNASATLLASLTPRSPIVQNPLDDRQLEAWRAIIEQLGQDFLHGRAQVDPKDPQKTCKNCHFQAICRIQERVTQLDDEDPEEDEAGGAYA
jgi:RecB family exonuclease